MQSQITCVGEKMNSTPLIELSAIAGKIAIDQTKLHPLAKEAIKWTIDQVGEVLKKRKQFGYRRHLQCRYTLWCL